MSPVRPRLSVVSGGAVAPAAPPRGQLVVAYAVRSEPASVVPKPEADVYHMSQLRACVMRGKEVEGRLAWRDDRPGYDVVVDGQRLTWEEFGGALAPFEGWTFRLSVREIEAAE